MKMKTKSENSQRKIIATNRRAFHDYEVLDRIEVGIKLAGNEVKSLRAGHCVISNAHAVIDPKKSLAWLLNLQIPEYTKADTGEEYEPKRKRALLLHKAEIVRLRQFMMEKGLTLLPLSIYFKNGYAKLELGVCRGRKLHDKREALKEKQAKREIARRFKR